MRSPAILLASALALFAAGIHALVTPEHWAESRLQGGLFLVLSIAQTSLAIELIRKPRHLVLIGGIFGNLAVLVVYVVSRTLGVPGGGHGGEPEAFGTLDILASLSEVALIMLLGALLPQYPDTHNERAGDQPDRVSPDQPPRPRASNFTVTP